MQTLIDPRRIPVALGERSYEIHIGSGLLSRLAGLLPFSMSGRGAYIITDAHVGPLYAPRVEGALREAGARRVETLTLPAGEFTKSFTMLESATLWALERGLDRKSVVFALGGGVIGDLAGFSAAIAMRGVPYVQIPTTLLAQVDSAVGGKTAIDVPAGKNLVGAFHQPVAVVADMETLDTLSEREMRAGYAEVVKYGLLGDAAFFETLERECGLLDVRDRAFLTRIVETSVRAKAEIVAADEREEGARALLNLGHTFGHALEKAAGMNGALLHGEAVSVGMVLAFEVSARAGLCAPGEAARVRAHLSAAGLPVRIADIPMDLPGDPADLIDAMRGDKKAQGGHPVFVLARGIGKAFVDSRADLDIVARALRDSADKNTPFPNG